MEKQRLESLILSSLFSDEMKKRASEVLYTSAKISYTQQDEKLLSRLVNRHFLSAYEQGIKDARGAVEARMLGWAYSTFLASAHQAGHEVAQKYLEVKA